MLLSMLVLRVRLMRMKQRKTEMKRDQYYSKLLQHLLQHLEGRP
ncbi:hypothetical protein EI42_05982 [Thermosporothrix hazakensis]|uniref:Uncharacterized protein n=1 Tax=Thermosporothrix hazakensis TaxID=644383 RepID=A0A326TSV8_THEHA|nr:hypothetical protein EI42_05982 [Thermosporothrix hazakensis]